MAHSKVRVNIASVLLCLGAAGSAACQNFSLDRRDANFSERLEVVDESNGPVIGLDQADASNNRSGFETGVTIKVDGIYHLFVAEMWGRPHLDLRIAHWTSTDGRKWSRLSTVLESAPDRSARNPRSEVWVQAMIFDEKRDRWTLFYVAYRGGDPDKGEARNLDYEGTIRRATSDVAGRSGLNGKFVDDGVEIMRPDARSTAWEGQQGVDSFFPYRVGEKWVALHGSHNHVPPSPWLVGVETGNSLTANHWTRVPTQQPSPIETLFIENPIVFQLPNKHFIAVYDANNYPTQPDIAPNAGNSVGYSISSDGIVWHQGRALVVQTKPGNDWSSDARTPMGLVPEEDGTFTLLYSARMKDRPFYAIGWVRLKLSGLK